MIRNRLDKNINWHSKIRPLQSNQRLMHTIIASQESSDFSVQRMSVETDLRGAFSSPREGDDIYKKSAFDFVRERFISLGLQSFEHKFEHKLGRSVRKLNFE